MSEVLYRITQSSLFDLIVGTSGVIAAIAGIIAAFASLSARKNTKIILNSHSDENKIQRQSQCVQGNNNITSGRDTGVKR